MAIEAPSALYKSGALGHVIELNPLPQEDFHLSNVFIEKYLFLEMLEYPTSMGARSTIPDLVNNVGWVKRYHKLTYHRGSSFVFF